MTASTYVFDTDKVVTLNVNAYWYNDVNVNDENDIASKFKVTIDSLFIFGRIIVLVIWPNTKDPLFGAALNIIIKEVNI